MFSSKLTTFALFAAGFLCSAFLVGVIIFGFNEEVTAYEKRVVDGKTLSSKSGLPDCHYYNWSIIQEMKRVYGTISNQEYQKLIREIDTSCEDG